MQPRRRGTWGIYFKRRDQMQHEKTNGAEGQAIQSFDDLPLSHYDRRQHNTKIQQRFRQLFYVLRSRVQ